MSKNKALKTRDQKRLHILPLRKSLVSFSLAELCQSYNLHPINNYSWFPWREKLPSWIPDSFFQQQTSIFHHSAEGILSLHSGSESVKWSQARPCISLLSYDRVLLHKVLAVLEACVYLLKFSIVFIILMIHSHHLNQRCHKTEKAAHHLLWHHCFYNGGVSLVSYVHDLYQFFHPARKNPQLFAMVSSVKIADSYNPLTGIFHIFL